MNSFSTPQSAAFIARYWHTGVWLDKTVADFAAEAAALEPGRITHVFEGQACRIGDLLLEAQALAAALQARGLVSGDVVSFQLPNWREALVIDLAAALLGLVVAPIVPIYRDAEVAHMLADSGARAAFFPSTYRGFDYAAMMQRLAPTLPALRMSCSVRDAKQGTDSYEALIGEQRPWRGAPPVDANAVKLLLYTSGTTGRPKAVLHSHNTGPVTLRKAFAHWGQRPGDTVLMASPVTHITGFSYGMELPLVCGTRTVFMERWDAAEAVALIDREQVSASMGATPFLHELLGEAARQGQRLPSLRLFACGGAEVPQALIRRCADVLQNCRAFRVYGSSEAPLVTLGFVREGTLDLAATTDGELVHYEARIVDDAGQALTVGHEGEICVRGPAMALGYADTAQSAESFDADGFFATGDLGRLTPEHAIVITGRKKDLINRGGEKISAKEVEDILHRHPAVDEAAVVAMPHERLGEAVCAYVVPRPGHSLDFAQVTQCMVTSGVARQKHPEQLVLVDSLPRTASGKVRKDQLRLDIRERLRAGTA
ncbi:AMP-binding protein [Aquabacterium sp.]|uniref:AMP-binding protein n=1 Tax=Aquabacterium sp. TaxID=1872578 RepID=UPI002C73E0CF|nr:AMP-binding protein [Aquabacterium sp.]HSW05239.1 AMP-binding protein [Aquabacterium sp.]